MSIATVDSLSVKACGLTCMGLHVQSNKFILLFSYFVILHFPVSCSSHWAVLHITELPGHGQHAWWDGFRYRFELACFRTWGDIFSKFWQKFSNFKPLELQTTLWITFGVDCKSVLVCSYPHKNTHPTTIQVWFIYDLKQHNLAVWTYVNYKC